MVGQGAVRAGASRRLPAASSRTALVLGGLVLELVLAGVPLAGLAHQSLSAGDGSLTSLRLAGQASIAAALRFHGAAQIARCKRHEGLNGFAGALPCPARAPTVTDG
jgi:hypothetical protein